MNKAILVGRLGKEPELRTTTSGKSVCTFSMATGTGEYTEWHNIVVWNKQAENCVKYLSSGSQCAISGSIKTRNYEANDGSKRYVTEITADHVDFLGKPVGKTDTPQANEQPQDMQEINEDLPF